MPINSNTNHTKIKTILRITFVGDLNAKKLYLSCTLIVAFGVQLMSDGWIG